MKWRYEGNSDMNVHMFLSGNGYWNGNGKWGEKEREFSGNGDLNENGIFEYERRYEWNGDMNGLEI